MAGAVAAGAAETAGGGSGDNHNCDGDPVDIIVDVANEITALGLPDIDTSLTDAQRRAIANGRGGFGSIVHDRAAALLEERYGDRFEYRRRGVDFYDTLTGRHIELTTIGQKRSHMDKGGEPRMTGKRARIRARRGSG